MTTASWSAVLGLMNLETINRPELRPIYEQAMQDIDARLMIRSRYNAAYRDATSGDGNGSLYRNRFYKAYAEDKLNSFYNPDLVNLFNPLIKIIDQSLFGFTPKKRIAAAK